MFFLGSNEDFLHDFVVLLLNLCDSNMTRLQYIAFPASLFLYFLNSSICFFSQNLQPLFQQKHTLFCTKNLEKEIFSITKVNYWHLWFNSVTTTAVLKMLPKIWNSKYKTEILTHCNKIVLAKPSFGPPCILIDDC